MTLVTGGAACGKSETAERLAAGLDGPRIYLATMEPFGEEAAARIARHRNLRAGKGFETVERFTDVGGVRLSGNANILLEDVGNLLANEMFSPAGSGPDAVLSGVRALLPRCRHLTVVTNELGCAGTACGESTLRYMKALGRINCELAAMADLVVEVVGGIPRIRKGAFHVDP